MTMSGSDASSVDAGSPPLLDQPGGTVTRRRWRWQHDHGPANSSIFADNGRGHGTALIRIGDGDYQTTVTVNADRWWFATAPANASRIGRCRRCAGLLLNDTDPDGQASLIVNAAGHYPLHGVVSLNTDGPSAYAPLADFHGTGQLHVHQIADEHGAPLPPPP